ncbi:hypothetical protein BT93_L4198 [Corymbia citriodora subsp. variegata]|uniref:Uncharacterized protein n=1 Tax=Corymbia citriodora subsp. variegata TaxID=360336 RepID=A0A8T0CL61_CORYI|nr:hypothetical protein BT93_L4198 [Corymbia citriodora subsp. variegata]
MVATVLASSSSSSYFAPPRLARVSSPRCPSSPSSVRLASNGTSRSPSISGISHLDPRLISPPSTPPRSLRVRALSVAGARGEEMEVSATGVVGQNDLLIVGPGVLGRLVAERWREEHPGCQIYGQTVTSDHHDELVQVGIIPSLKGTKTDQRFPYVIFCAPPSRTPDYPGDVRIVLLSLLVGALGQMFF